MGRLGHAVTPLDGIVELLIHGQLWVRGATCPGAKTREEILRFRGVEKVAGTLFYGNKERHSGLGVGEEAVALGLRNVGSFTALGRLQPSPESNNQRISEPSRLFDVTVQTP